MFVFMGIYRGTSWIECYTALSFEGEIEVSHAVYDDGSRVEFTIDDGTVVHLMFSAASLRRFSAEAEKALAGLSTCVVDAFVQPAAEV
jgi:hypothetical protein